MFRGAPSQASPPGLGSVPRPEVAGALDPAESFIIAGFTRGGHWRYPVELERVIPLQDHGAGSQTKQATGSPIFMSAWRGWYGCREGTDRPPAALSSQPKGGPSASCS
jgi:hypothetical protein